MPYSRLQMMLVSGHKTQKTFMHYIKLSSEKMADEIAAIVNGVKRRSVLRSKAFAYI